MQKATLTLCQSSQALIGHQLTKTVVRSNSTSRWDKWKPRFKKPVPTEGEKLLIAQLQETQKKRTKLIGETEFSVVKALDKSYEIEKYDIFGRGGLTDPFDLAIEEQGKRGELDSPILVPSVEQSRIIGCVCEKDLKEVKWMRIERGEKRRCECGNWFEMLDVRPDKLEEMG